MDDDLAKYRRPIPYIESSGFVCRDLCEMLGGLMEHVPIPWWNIPKRVVNEFYLIFPTFRWYPPDGADLECVHKSPHNAWYACRGIKRACLFRVDGPERSSY